MKARAIELHIEELVVHGLEMPDRHRLCEAATRELDRLLDERGLPAVAAGRGGVRVLDAGSFDVRSASLEQALGARIALVLYGIPKLRSPER
jgi:hypothetical protein